VKQSLRSRFRAQTTIANADSILTRTTVHFRIVGYARDNLTIRQRHREHDGER
jgi:hypothetical protein